MIEKNVIELRYIKGKLNDAVDDLSRMPIEEILEETIQVKGLMLNRRIYEDKDHVPKNSGTSEISTKKTTS